MGFSSRFRLFSSGIFSCLSVDLQVAEVGSQSKCSCVFCLKPVKIFILRSGVVFTPEVGMKHVDRRWKAYPVGNKVKLPESEHGAEKC